MGRVKNFFREQLIRDMKIPELETGDYIVIGDEAKGAYSASSQRWSYRFRFRVRRVNELNVEMGRLRICGNIIDAKNKPFRAITIPLNYGDVDFVSHNWDYKDAPKLTIILPYVLFIGKNPHLKHFFKNG